MSQLFFDPVGGYVPVGDDHEPGSGLLDPIVAQAHERERWEARAAQWRARALAEAVFGGPRGADVEAHLAGRAPGGPFRGLLHLRVPFDGLASHRQREAAFLTLAAQDPVLSRVPLLYVFGAGEAAPPEGARR